MKIPLFILTIFFITSYANNSEQKINDELPKTDIIIDSANTNMDENIKNESPLKFLEEDSIAFLNSTNKEEELINKYCKCTKAKGSLSIDCRDFIKELSIYQAISDKIRTKYFYNDAISDKLNSRIKALNDKFNSCSK